MTPSVGANTFSGVDEQGGATYHDIYTARGDFAFSQWAHPASFKTVGQINLSYVSLVKADTLYLGSIVNTSREEFKYLSGWFSGSTSYLANQYHLTANHSSAVASVAAYSFIFVGDLSLMPQFSPLKTTQTPASTPHISSLTPSLVGDPHVGVDEQGGTSYHDGFTARGVLAFSPWSDPNRFKSVGQINNSYVSLVKADTVYLGSIVNTSRAQFEYYYSWFTGTSSYLADQFHLTVNHSSAVASVSINSFRFHGDQTTMPQFSVAKSTQISSKTSPLTPTPTHLLGATGITFNTSIIKAMF